MGAQSGSCVEWVEREKVEPDCALAKNRVIIEGSAQDGGLLRLSGVLMAVVVVGGVRGFGGAVLIERLAGSREASKKFGDSLKIV